MAIGKQKILKKILNKEKNDYNNKYLNKIVELLKIIDNIEKEKKLELIFDDFFFIKDKEWFLNKNKNSLKYPSLCFYLIKNPKVEEDFIKYFSDFEYYDTKNNKFPLYFLLLRIFSTKEIIKCDDYKEDNNIISKFIKESLHSLIKENLKNDILPKDINCI